LKSLLLSPSRPSSRGQPTTTIASESPLLVQARRIALGDRTPVVLRVVNLGSDRYHPGSLASERPVLVVRWGLRGSHSSACAGRCQCSPAAGRGACSKVPRSASASFTSLSPRFDFPPHAAVPDTTSSTVVSTSSTAVEAPARSSGIKACACRASENETSGVEVAVAETVGGSILQAGVTDRAQLRVPTQPGGGGPSGRRQQQLQQQRQQQRQQQWQQQCQAGSGAHYCGRRAGGVSLSIPDCCQVQAGMVRGGAGLSGHGQ
jgi:hypothetical protein